MNDFAAITMPLLLLPPLLLSTTCDKRACTEDTLQLHLLQWRPSGQLKLWASHYRTMQKLRALILRVQH